MRPPIPCSDDGKISALALAQSALAEEFECGFVVVSYRDARGLTRFATREWGNAFAVAKLCDDYSQGALDANPEIATDEFEEEPE